MHDLAGRAATFSERRNCNDGAAGTEAAEALARRPGTIIGENSILSRQAAGPRWRIFHANSAIWPAVMELCEEARESLALEQYIFSHEGVGRKLLDVLTLKAREGIRVRLLVDGFGSNGLAESPAGEALRRAGGELVLYNPAGNLLRSPIGGLHRLHRKSVICDGRQLMVGGACYAARMSDWRDTMVRIEGAVAGSALSAFEVAWRYALGDSAPHAPPPAKAPVQEHSDWSYLTSDPVRPVRQQIYSTLLHRLRNAERSVTLTTPYLAPDLKMWNALKGALSRGVRVRLLIPDKSDHPAIDLLSHHVANALAKRGAEVYGYSPTMVHAKIAMVDDAWASVSSFNLDILSFWINVENGLASRSPDFIEALKLQFECDIATSRRF